ncbi:Complex III assembly factor LYRM7 [Armadillidium vulgare]|nr:Complex III assembly factor LYRM7 [Armadillidium vulgare]
MSSSTLRNQVLTSFKKLHQTRKTVFKGDTYALDVARRQINDEYSRNKNLTKEETINALVKHANDVEEVLRTTIIQAVRTEGGNYQYFKKKPIRN